MSYQAVKSLLSRGVSRPTLYRVQLPLLGQANSQLEFLCNAASVPEVTSNTIAVNGQESMGVVREQATSIMFASPFSISVISDRDFIVYKAIRNQWFNTLTSNSGSNPNSFFGQGGGASQRMAYYNEVKRDITLTKLEYNGTNYHVPFEIVFNNAFPVKMGSIDLGSDKYDEVTQYGVDFAYENYTFKEGFLSSISNDSIAGLAGQVLSNVLGF